VKETDVPIALENTDNSASNSISLQTSDKDKDSSSGNLGMVNAMRSPMNMGFGGSQRMGNQGFGMGGGMNQPRPGSFNG
jgi:hypothetical protein